MAAWNKSTDAEDMEGFSEHEEVKKEDQAAVEKGKKGDDSSRIKQKDSELQAYFDVLAEQMALDKLHESMKRRDADMLSQALREFEDLQLDKSKKESYQNLYKQAQAIQHDVIQYRKLLREARESGRPESKLLEDRLLAVKRINLEPYLREEVEKCRKLLEKLSVKERDTHILAMDKKTMAEIKSYNKPSPIVQRIMTAALLLLGEDEDTTSKWSKVQSLCNPDGKFGMLRRMMNFDPADIHPEISGRVRFLLKYISLDDAKKASPGAGTFYVWSKSVIGEDPEEVDAAYSDYGQGGSRANWTSREFSDADGNDSQYAAQRRNGGDDITSGLDDDDYDDEYNYNYNRRVEQEVRKKRDEELYKRTLQIWINKEKKIFTDQKKEIDRRRTFEVSPRSRPTGSQNQTTNRPSGAGEQSYRGPTNRPKQNQLHSIRYM